MFAGRCWFSWIVLGVGAVVLCGGGIVLVVDSSWGVGGLLRASFLLVRARYVRDGVPGLKDVEGAGGVSQWLVDFGMKVVDVGVVWGLAEPLGSSGAVAFSRGGGRDVDRGTDWGLFLSA